MGHPLPGHAILSICLASGNQQNISTVRRLLCRAPFRPLQTVGNQFRCRSAEIITKKQMFTDTIQFNPFSFIYFCAGLLAIHHCSIYNIFYEVGQGMCEVFIIWYHILSYRFDINIEFYETLLETFWINTCKDIYL